ncbi:ATP-dependent zinc metalloprotease FtsH [Jeotgalibaca ciconiae]|uniref:ATP-dependent zinc metalloprotease FtsH n=1 Tax=Jeotgalibaca ciconiae TaxID=2496265 RepID=A0A3Q9BMW0_9LACT|nr:ATP-dependent zinc metalloprotease FtsH [Jeotgalibaca ciconiae]AZP04736.1 ATP-dependent metallopeptidase FtsH/Yme1/Tma family protein [Jeotgalibaca ciconiae]
MPDKDKKTDKKLNFPFSNQPNNRKPWIYYFLVIFSFLTIWNTLLYPTIEKRQVEEVPYSEFLEKVDDGKVSEAKIEANQIVFVATDESNARQVYNTGTINDPDLIIRLEDNNVVFARDIPVEASPILSFLISWILPLLAFWALGSFLSRQMMKRMGGGVGGSGGALSFGKSNAKVYVKAGDSKTFDDVAGQDEAKEALSEIVDYLHQPKKYQAIGAKNPKGVLLVGPPGTGKTLLAQAVAGEGNVPFFSISGSEFVEMFVGRGAAKVRDLFKEANEKAPCIVFIDEIDTIGKKRDGAGFSGNDEREQTLNQLLAEMDGFEENKGVVILAATNRPESLDAALLRPGRFDRRVPVELPDLAGREAILKVHAKKYILANDIDFNTIARATSGASGAEIANIINEAALRAVREGRSKVSQMDLEESVETVIAGYQRKGAVISPKEKEIVSYHEIGHALVAAKQIDSAPVHKITIIPRTSGALGYTMQIEEDEKSLISKEELYNKLVTLAGGRVAEEIIFGSKSTGASNDIEQMTKIARAMITRYGMSDTFGMMQIETQTNQYLGGDTTMNVSAGTAERVDQEVMDLLRSAHQKADKILSENLDKLHELSHQLLVKETITGHEFMEILNT